MDAELAHAVKKKTLRLCMKQRLMVQKSRSANFVTLLLKTANKAVNC